jgi:CheY-like chemotaxis protein
MPGLSGHEFIHQLLPTRPDAKILYLSGYAEDAVATPINPGEAKAFLQKPFTLQNLSRKVREVLGSPTN